MTVVERGVLPMMLIRKYASALHDFTYAAAVFFDVDAAGDDEVYPAIKHAFGDDDLAIFVCALFTERAPSGVACLQAARMQVFF